MKGNNPNLCNNWVHTSLHLLLDIAFPFINLKYFVRVLHFDLSQKAEKYYVSGEGGGATQATFSVLLLDICRQKRVEKMKRNATLAIADQKEIIFQVEMCAGWIVGIVFEKVTFCTIPRPTLCCFNMTIRCKCRSKRFLIRVQSSYLRTKIILLFCAINDSTVWPNDILTKLLFG